MKKEREDVLQALEQRFPCSLWRRQWWGRLCLCRPMQEVYGGADTHLQPVKDPTPEQVDAPKGGCEPVGSPCWSRVLAVPVAPWRQKPMLEQVSRQDLWLCGEHMLKQSVLKDCTSWKGPILKQFVMAGSLWEGLHSAAGAECDESSLWWGRSSRDNVWWTGLSPHSPLPCTASGEETENLGVKLGPGRWKRWGKNVLRLGFSSHYPTPVWLMIN